MFFFIKYTVCHQILFYYQNAPFYILHIYRNIQMLYRITVICIIIVITFRVKKPWNAQFSLRQQEGLLQVIPVGSPPSPFHINQMGSQCKDNSKKSHPCAPTGAKIPHVQTQSPVNARLNVNIKPNPKKNAENRIRERGTISSLLHILAP